MWTKNKKIMTIKYYSKERSSLLKYLFFSSNKILNIDASLFGYSKEAIYQMMLPNHISKDKTISMLSHQCNTVIDYILPFTKNIDIFKNNALQTYPIKCINIDLTDKIFIYLKSRCINIYSWSSYHLVNSFNNVKNLILLLPLDTYSFQKSKEFILKSNHE